MSTSLEPLGLNKSGPNEPEKWTESARSSQFFGHQSNGDVITNASWTHQQRNHNNNKSYFFGPYCWPTCIMPTPPDSPPPSSTIADSNVRLNFVLTRNVF